MGARNFLTFIILTLGVNASADVVEPTLPSPFPVSSISSDFGPRNVTTGSRFHEGVDYAQIPGTLIPPVEQATITDIGFDDRGYGWRMYAKNGPVREWRYGHMFTNPGTPPQDSGEFELKKIIFYEDEIYPTRPTDTRYVIIRWQNRTENRAYSVLSSRANFAVPNGNMGNIRGISGDEAIKTTNTLSGFVGPVGDSGVAAGHPHLDLGFNRTLNPLTYVIHNTPDSGFAMNFIAPQNGAAVFHYRSGTVNKEQINVEINSRSGLDLDLVEYYVRLKHRGR